MNTHKKTTETYRVTSPSLRAKIGAAAASGCLALAMIPGVALADTPSDAQAPDMQQPPMGQMQQGGFGGTNQQAPMGQMGEAPSGQFGGAPADNMGGFGQMAEPPAFDQGNSSSTDQTNETANAQQAPEQSASNESGSTSMPQPPAAPEQGTGGNGASLPNAPWAGDAAQQGTGEAPSSGSEGTETNTPPAAPADNAGAPTSQGQMPSNNQGQMQPRANDVDQKIIDAIDDEGVKAAAQGGNKDFENKQPAIPEGEINVAQLLDQIRETVFGSAFAPVSLPSQTDGAAQPNATGLPQLPLQAGMTQPVPGNAPSTTAPASLPLQNADNQAPKPEMQIPADAQNSDAAAATGDEEADAATGDSATQTDQAKPSANDTSDLPLFQKILNAVVEFFKGLAK